MKKLYSFLFSISLISVASAQVELREYTGTGGTQVGNDISGTTDTIVTSQEGLMWIHYAVKNTSGADAYLRVKRLRISVPGGWEDEVCWGQDPDTEFEGACFTAAQMPTNPWTTPNIVGGNHAQMIYSGNIGDLKIGITVGSGGVGRYRYYIMPNQGTAPIDSIDVLIESSLGIVDEKEVLGMTAYPNPANNVLTVNTTGTDNVVLKITDVLGKVVYYDEVGAIKKVDVSDYRNGVYLVSVYNEGVLVQTRRVVVKH